MAFIVSLWILCRLLQGVFAGSVAFQASPSVQSLVPPLLATAKQLVSQNSSSYVSASFPSGIGSQTYTSIFTNWPVPRFVGGC